MLYLIFSDRDQRTLNKYQIVFDAQPQSDEGEALDQLEAEIDRVLKRRTCFQSGIDSKAKAITRWVNNVVTTFPQFQTPLTNTCVFQRQKTCD